MGLMPGPCVYCGALNYQPSIGGPGICPSCDCGNFGPDVVQRLGNQIEAMRKRLSDTDAMLCELRIENRILRDQISRLS